MFIRNQFKSINSFITLKGYVDSDVKLNLDNKKGCFTIGHTKHNAKIDIYVYGAQAIHMHKFLKKGMRVYCEAVLMGNYKGDLIFNCKELIALGEK